MLQYRAEFSLEFTLAVGYHIDHVPLTFPVLLTCRLACRLSGAGHMTFAVPITCDGLCTTHITNSWDFLGYLQTTWYVSFNFLVEVYGTHHDTRIPYISLTFPYMLYTIIIIYNLLTFPIHYVINHISYSKPPYHMADHFPNASYSILATPQTTVNQLIK